MRRQLTVNLTLLCLGFETPASVLALGAPLVPLLGGCTPKATGRFGSASATATPKVASTHVASTKGWQSLPLGSPGLM